MQQGSGDGADAAMSRKRREHALIADAFGEGLTTASPSSPQRQRQTPADPVLPLQPSLRISLRTSQHSAGLTSGVQPFCVGADPNPTPPGAPQRRHVLHPPHPNVQTANSSEPIPAAPAMAAANVASGENNQQAQWANYCQHPHSQQTQFADYYQQNPHRQPADKQKQGFQSEQQSHQMAHYLQQQQQRADAEERKQNEGALVQYRDRRLRHEAYERSLMSSNRGHVGDTSTEQNLGAAYTRTDLNSPRPWQPGDPIQYPGALDHSISTEQNQGAQYTSTSTAADSSQSLLKVPPSSTELNLGAAHTRTDIDWTWWQEHMDRLSNDGSIDKAAQYPVGPQHNISTDQNQGTLHTSTSTAAASAFASWPRVPATSYSRTWWQEHTDRLSIDEDADVQAAMAASLVQLEVDTLRATAEPLPLRPHTGLTLVWQNEKDQSVIQAQQAAGMHEAPDPSFQATLGTLVSGSQAASGVASEAAPKAASNSVAEATGSKGVKLNGEDVRKLQALSLQELESCIPASPKADSFGNMCKETDDLQLDDRVADVSYRSLGQSGLICDEDMMYSDIGDEEDKDQEEDDDDEDEEAEADSNVKDLDWEVEVIECQAGGAAEVDPLLNEWVVVDEEQPKVDTSSNNSKSCIIN